MHQVLDHIYVNSFNFKNNPEKGVSYNPKYIDKKLQIKLTYQTLQN